VFGNSWRVRRDGSLFDYKEGNTTATYTKPGFPKQKATVDDLPDGPVSQARQACSDIEHPEVRDWCILDVVCTCTKSIAASTRDLTGPRQTTDPIPDGPLTVGGDVCLQKPESLAYQPAPEPTCPPTTSPCIHLVREKSGVKLSSKLPVDARDPGHYDEASDLQTTPIAAGTTVDSYLLHLNETNERTGGLEGAIVLPAEIVGVALTESSLKTGDSALSDAPGDLPSGRQGRALDLGTGDTVKIGPGRRATRVRFDSVSGLDQIRIVTAEAANE